MDDQQRYRAFERGQCFIGVRLVLKVSDSQAVGSCIHHVPDRFVHRPVFFNVCCAIMNLLFWITNLRAHLTHALELYLQGFAKSRLGREVTAHTVYSAAGRRR